MKNLFITCALAGLLLASCQKEEETASLSKDPVLVSFTTKLPVKAGGMTTFSTDQGGTIENVNFSTGYDLRYIMGIYDGSGNLVGTQTVKTVDVPAPVTFDVRLVPGTYKFVFWADIVQQGSTADYHYNTADLKTITVMDVSYLGNDDTKDAYTNAVSVDVSAGINQSITLNRPFGKIRVIATDVQQGVTPAKAKLKYTATDMPNGFNAFNATPLTTAFTNPEYAPTAIYNDLSGSTQTMAWDYIFAPASGQKGYNFEVMIYDASNVLLKNRVLTNIPIERNKLTTVKGNFFTSSLSISVNVNNAFDGENTKDPEEVSISDLQAYLNQIYQTYAGSNQNFTLAVRVVGPISGNYTIDIPPYAITDIASVILSFSADIAANVTFTSSGIAPTSAFARPYSTAGYSGKLAFNLLSISGSFKSDITSTMPWVYGTLANFRNGIDPTSAGFYWAVGTMADLNWALYATPNAADKGSSHDPWTVACNKGIVLISDITNCNSVDETGAVYNQQPVAIGGDPNDPKNFDNAILSGFVFDGNGHVLSGYGYNNLIQVYADNVVLKNLKLSNTWVPAQHSNKGIGNGIAAYKADGLLLDGVQVTGCYADGVVLNGSTASATNVTVTGNGLGQFHLHMGTNVTTEIPALTLNTPYTITGNRPIWANYTNADQNSFAASGWYCTQVLYESPRPAFIWSQVSTPLVHLFPATGLWAKNRYDVASWTSATWNGLSAIKSTVNVSGGLGNRSTGFNEDNPIPNFYNTQGRGMNVINKTNSQDWDAESKIYISAEMLNVSYKPYMTGLWTALNVADADPNNDEYPIITAANMICGSADTRTYTLDNMCPKWKLYKVDGTWVDGPALTEGWHTLKMSAVANNVNYYIDGVLVGSYGTVSGGVILNSVILQNYNFNKILLAPASYLTYANYANDAYFADAKAWIR